MHSSELIHYEDLDTVVQTHSRHLGPVYEYKEDLDEQLISPREYSQQFIQSVSQWSRQSGLSKRVHSRRTRRAKTSAFIKERIVRFENPETDTGIFWCQRLLFCVRLCMRHRSICFKGFMKLGLWCPGASRCQLNLEQTNFKMVIIKNIAIYFINSAHCMHVMLMNFFLIYLPESRWLRPELPNL